MFLEKLNKIIDRGQSNSIILCGNVYDIFWDGNSFIPLIQFLNKKITNRIHVVYELNGPIRFSSPEEKNKIKNAWIQWKTGNSPEEMRLKESLQSLNTFKRPATPAEVLTKQFESDLLESIGNPTLALEFLRQLTICVQKLLNEKLLITIEAGDMLLPEGNGDVASLNDSQLHRISIVQDWISDPAFINGKNTVLFIAESRSLIHHRVSKLPQVLSINVPLSSAEDRKRMVAEHKFDFEFNVDDLVKSTSCLSLHAFRQFLKGWEGSEEEIVDKIEEYIQSQLGEEVVEFKKPSHKLDDCVGFNRLKTFLKERFIPLLLSSVAAITGAAVAGAIGGGKTYIFEALASELNMPVLVLKNIRSQWFGQTDVIFERLRRVLESLDRVLIFIDEADTQFGGIDGNVHETEKRLTGKIQAMMSDSKLKGKVFWFLMTARIHCLSPDIRRPGRAGDLIIPVLDPINEDRLEFIHWMLKGVKILEGIEDAQNDTILINMLSEQLPPDYSAASFSSLKNNLKHLGTFNTREHLLNEVKDHIQPAIAATRKYQTLQALVNCTRRSLLPNPNVTEKEREDWANEIRRMESLGIK